MATASLPPPATDLVDRILSEGPLGMSEAARRLGTIRGGTETHSSTPTRWATRGVRLADGTLLKLEAIRLNGRLATSWPAIVRFTAAQQDNPPAATHSTPASATRTASARRRASEAAAKKLEAAGI
jgi:hypothetical protein